MGRFRSKRPSPAMVVAIVALVFAVAGSAVAGVATISVLSKKEKKQTRNIAKDEIDKAAPGLSVANAQNAVTAGNANAVGGIPPSQIGAVGRTNFVPDFCLDDDHNGTDCTSVALDLPRSGRVLVLATASYVPQAFDDLSGTGSGSDLTTAASGSCVISLDGIPIGANAPVAIGDTVDFESLALNRVTLPLDPGQHTFALRCTESDGTMAWDEASISAVMLGSG
jgi:hypothetical protein